MRLSHLRRVGQKVAVGTLAAALVTTAVTPAIAGGPHRERHGGAHRQEQEVTAEGKRRGKTVKKSFANNVPIAIPETGAIDEFGISYPYPSTIQVSGFKRKPKIVDVNLTLRGFSHNAPFDVDVMLVAPGGRNAVVLGDVGQSPAGGSVTNLTLTLDDEAASPLPDDDELTSGSFRPFDSQGPTDSDGPDLLTFPAPAPTPSGSDALFTFDGINPNGQWQLFVIDDSFGGTGSLDGWTLQITAKSKKKRR